MSAAPPAPAPTRGTRLARWALLLQLLVLATLLALVIFIPVGPLARLNQGLTRDAVKMALDAYHTLLPRLGLFPGLLAAAVLGGGLAALLPRWPRLLLATAGGALAAFALPLGAWQSPVLVLVLVSLASQPELAAGRPWLGALPGLALIWPGGAAVGLSREPGPRITRAAVGLGLVWALLLSAGLDPWLAPRAFSPGAEDPGSWPQSGLDPRVQRVLVAAPGLICEFHDIDLVDQGALVVAEGSGRLIALGADGQERSTVALPTHFGFNQGVPMDSETDPETGLTWALLGADQVATWTLQDGRLQRDGNAQPLALLEDHSYLVLMPEIDRLAAVHVNVSRDRRPPVLHLFDRHRQLRPLAIPLVTERGAPMPTPRDITWVPPLRKLIVAPDFGDALWVVDPLTGRARPWKPLSTLNGRIQWEDALGQLIVPMPQSRELWLVDVQSTKVARRIPVQLGVRAAAVDVERDLLLTASVISGAVQVRRLSTGELLDEFDGMMPMVRELVLDTDAGVAWLTTWLDVYRFPYADPR